MRSSIFLRGVGLAAALAACTAPSRPSGEHTSAAGAVAPPAMVPGAAPAAPEPPSDCAAPEPLFEGGARAGALCPAEVEAAGATLVDLSDAWTSRLFADRPELGRVGVLSYRAMLVALAKGRFDTLPETHRAHHDQYLELYGITPALSVLAAHLADDERHRCHDAIDDAPLLRLEHILDAWRPLAEQRADPFTLAALKSQLTRGVEERGVERIEQLAGDARYGGVFKQYERVRDRVEAVTTAQAHLRCDGLLGPAEGTAGLLDYATVGALHTYLRRHAVVSWTLEPESAKVMATDSRVLDYRAMLRALRERVVDATGLIEDGTAAGAPEPVLGEPLDSRALDATGPRPAPEHAAPDLVARATTAAATALGWTSPAATRRFFESEGAARPARVALRLPPPPSYHTAHMDLRAEIDRGDVWPSHPAPKAERRPTLTVYARHEGQDIALVRWGTTVGGHQRELVGNRVTTKYKESPVGPRIWRDLVVTPSWIPPKSTPPRELLRLTRRGYELRQDLLGPSYASAYGLVMLTHHRDDGPWLTDEGIRTHGSVSYDSIHKGNSHGCHRLHNHRAVRLGAFLLQHRNTVAHGAEPFGYARWLGWARQRWAMEFPNRGFRYELDPPVPVEVLKGRTMSRTGWR